jgi:AcrR family transcriptional regulator
MNLDTTFPSNASARDRILFTAQHLFYQQGIRATGIDKIIKEAQVTKVTFYRHFPSKNDLIVSFLTLRHQRWIEWFKEGLEQRGNSLEALPDTLDSWFASAHFRGCAFINSVNEMAEVLPEILTISQHHKQAMIDVIESITPHHLQQTGLSSSLALAIDGAIIHVQITQDHQRILASLKHIVTALLKSG